MRRKDRIKPPARPLLIQRITAKIEPMFCKKGDGFIQWLDVQLRLNGWNDRQLALRAGLSHSVISKARSGILPRWEACVALAAALDVPAELVFRQAGLLPPQEAECAEVEELRLLLPRLLEEDRRELVQIARLKAHRNNNPPARGR